MLEAFEEHLADNGDDCGFEVGFEMRLAGTGQMRSLGEKVADAESDAEKRAATSAIESDISGGQKVMELAGDDALEQGELVWVMGVKGGAIDGCGVGDVQDGDLFELLGLEEMNEGLLKQLASAANARVERLRDLEFSGHGSIGR